MLDLNVKDPLPAKQPQIINFNALGFGLIIFNDKSPSVFTNYILTGILVSHEVKVGFPVTENKSLIIFCV